MTETKPNKISIDGSTSVRLKRFQKNAKKALILVLVVVLVGGIGTGVGLHVKSKDNTFSDHSKERNKDTELIVASDYLSSQ